MIIVVVTEEEISDGSLGHFSYFSQHCLQIQRLSVIERKEKTLRLDLSLVVVHRIHDHDALCRHHKHGHVKSVIGEAVDSSGHLLAGGETLLGQAERALLPLLSAGVGEDAEAEGENQ